MPKSLLSGLNYEAGLTCIDAGDYENAAEFFQKAADCSHADAQFYLGIMYLNGLGLLRSREDALFWLGKAACQGHDEAQRELCILKDRRRPFAVKIKLPPEDLLEKIYQEGLKAEDLGYDYRAIALWKKILEQDIRHVGALEALARIYTRSGKPELAKIYSHMALKIASSCP